MVPFFFCSFSASLSSWFWNKKFREENWRIKIWTTEFLKLIFVICYFGKIDLPDLDLLILKSRNDGTVIWKLDFKKLDLDGWMCVKPKCWMRNLEIRFLKIDGTEIMVPVFACIFLSASFPLPFLLFIILKIVKKAGGEMHKTKMRTRKI